MTGGRPALRWRRADSWWERIQDNAKHAQRDGQPDRAARGWLLGWLFGAVALPPGDPRRACGLANAAAAARHWGWRRADAWLQRRALEGWSAAPAWVGRMQLAPRARSSMFHLRLERVQGVPYDARLRALWLDHVRRARAQVVAGKFEPTDGECRWHIERPPTRDDGRRLAAACFLLFCAEPRQRPAADASGATPTA